MSDQDAGADPASPTPAGNAPSGSVATVASHPARAAQPLLVAPTSEKAVNTLSLDVVAVACLQLPDLLFEFDSSFPNPGVADVLRQVGALRARHRDLKGRLPPLSVFGHADPSGDDEYNKQLSGRRSMAIYGALTHDVGLWNSLFDKAQGGDDWKAKKVTATMQAVLGLPAGTSRDDLVTAYMQFLCGDPLAKADFLGRGADADGKADFQGCSEFNPLVLLSISENASLSKTDRNEQNAANRRVIVFMFRPGVKIDAGRWPCPSALAKTTQCRKRFFGPPRTGDIRRAAGDERRAFATSFDTFACRFYDRIARLSPCEVPALPIPGDLVSPQIDFPQADALAATAAAPSAATRSGITNAASQQPVKAGAIGPATRAVVVRKPHATAARIDVDLKTDKPFDGVGTFTVEPADRIAFFLGSKRIGFSGGDNVFTGAELGVGVTLFAEGSKASSAMDDVTLTLVLSGGSKGLGPAAHVKMTAVEVTLDICDPRVDAHTNPLPLAQPPEGSPAPGSKPSDKIFRGRALCDAMPHTTSERAMLLVRQIKPATFDGKLVLTTIDGRVRTFTTEVATDDPATQQPLPARHAFPASDVKAFDRQFFAEGFTLSSAPRDTGYKLGIEGLQEDADRVAITVVHGEIVSTRKPADVPTIAIAPEQPARETRSDFFPAPIIIGARFPITIHPFLQILATGGAPDALKFTWSTAQAAKLELKDTAKETVQLKGLHISAAQDDIEVDVIVEDSGVGKFKLIHKLTIVDFQIQAAMRDEIVLATSPINFIRNPAVTPILPGATSADCARVEITNATVQSALNWSADDPRIAWRITGGQHADAKGSPYEGAADFLAGDSARRGTTVELAGKTTGDILVEAWSGGFAYAMFRSHVADLLELKYRLNRILTNAVPAQPASGGKPAKPAIPARGPTRSHADALNHIAVVNVYLRQVGIKLIPDTSSLAAAPTPGNPQIGTVATDARVVSATQVSPGHFDVVVTDQGMTFNASDSPGGDRAVRVNARNEVITFAYIQSLSSGDTVLAQAQLWPDNHSPGGSILDKGVPSTSLTPKTGIADSVPAGSFRMRTLQNVFLKPTPASSPTRNVDLLWGITVPTTSIDKDVAQFLGTPPLDPASGYGSTLAHEVGHVLGLRHRIASGDPFPDGLTVPRAANLMSPSASYRTNENLDIIQAKAIRESEALKRTP